MAKPDPFLNLLKGIGFVPLRLPRADVEPLQMLSVDGKDLNLLGQLTDVMVPEGGATVPPVKQDIQTSNQIQGTKTSQVKLSIGLNILGNILQALTGKNLDVSAAYSRASTLMFEFDNVTVDAVSIILLDKFLNQSDIDSNARQVQELMIEGNAAVTTAIAKTKKYLVSAQDSNGVDISVSVPVIQGIAGGSLGVTSASGNNTKVAYEGTTPITFGVQAIRLGFDQSGHITGFTSVQPGSGAVRGLEPAATGAPNIVDIGGIFANVTGGKASAAAK